MAGHFNPLQLKHGAPTDSYRHVGDLGNIEAGNDGVAIVKITDSQLSLNGLNSIIGRGVVVHAGRDDMGRGGDEGSLKTGNAGGRVGCGVVARTN
jgi:Cu-Zn family superoxide dismutase